MIQYANALTPGNQIKKNAGGEHFSLMLVGIDCFDILFISEQNFKTKINANSPNYISGVIWIVLD
jgi:hypothetical protein